VEQGDVIGVGYEGSDVEQFVQRLRLRSIDRVVDVRLTPISRKKGFSKTALSQRLAAAGIAYSHFRSLGNAKSNRDGFAALAGQEAVDSRARYRVALAEPEAVGAVEQVRSFARTERVALLCFEADEARCHRAVLLDVLSEPTLVTAV
jgi:uncharacterized protein (DUF488 family)